jgi:hypothetical protein
LFFKSFITHAKSKRTVIFIDPWGYNENSVTDFLIGFIPGMGIKDGIEAIEGGSYLLGCAFILSEIPVGKGLKLLKLKKLTKGQAGRFADLDSLAVTGDKLTPHHMPQDALGFTSREDGGALMLPQTEHFMTRTYGFKGALTAKQDAGVAFRDVLTLDIRDIRRIGGSQYNQGLRDLLDYYRTNFPELMKK